MATSVSVSVSAVMAQPTEITTMKREGEGDVDVDGENNTKIFRYKLSNDILSIITQFAKIHQLDDRHSYKEAWEVWLNENKEYIKDETDRLVAAGYKGDVEEKMYIAGRYYFREKVKIKKNKGEVEGKKVSAVSKKKREYIVMGKDFIKAIDVHLLTAMKQKGFKPAFAYKTFCEQHIELLRTEIRRLVNEEKHIFTDKDMNMKIKKTYKNRYFMLSKAGEGEDSENED